MSLPTLVIAGINVPIMSWLEYEQTIDPIGGSTPRRMANGAALKLSHWRKWRVSISAGGWIPSVLNAIDYDQPFEIELPMPVGLRTGEALPPGWVARAAPYVEHTVVDRDGNSTRYVYIKMTVIAEPPSQRHGRTRSRSWNLTCEVA